MGLKFVTQMKDVAEYLSTCLQIISNEVKRALSYLGEQTIKEARDRSGDESWFDQTGNLRSSVGYGIYSFGRKEIESAFKIVSNGIEGSEEGRKMIDELAAQYSNTYALVVVAAMNYAEDVEAKESKDVLASAELFARNKITLYLKKAKSRAENLIAKL